MTVRVALATRAATSCELAITSWLVRRLIVAERVVIVLLSAVVAVARLTIASAISASRSALFAWPNASFSNSGILPELLTGQGKLLFESRPGSIVSWEAFPDFKIVCKHPCFLDELLACHDDLFCFSGWLTASA